MNFGLRLKGIDTKIEDGVLKIKSEIRMRYLNADSPFDKNGWYDTGDIVEADGLIRLLVKKTTNFTGGLKILHLRLSMQL